MGLLSGSWVCRERSRGFQMESLIYGQKWSINERHSSFRQCRSTWREETGSARAIFSLWHHEIAKITVDLSESPTRQSKITISHNLPSLITVSEKFHVVFANERYIYRYLKICSLLLVSARQLSAVQQREVKMCTGQYACYGCSMQIYNTCNGSKISTLEQRSALAGQRPGERALTALPYSQASWTQATPWLTSII